MGEPKWCFRIGPTQIRLYSHRGRLELEISNFMEKRTFRVSKTKALIFVFVFAYADCWFSHEAAHFMSCKFRYGYKR